jgi:hypothetical protein
VLDNANNHELLFSGEQCAGTLDYLPESDKCMALFKTHVQMGVVLPNGEDALELGKIVAIDWHTRF